MLWPIYHRAEVLKDIQERCVAVIGELDRLGNDLSSALARRRHFSILKRQLLDIISASIKGGDVPDSIPNIRRNFVVSILSLWLLTSLQIRSEKMEKQFIDKRFMKGDVVRVDGGIYTVEELKDGTVKLKTEKGDFSAPVSNVRLDPKQLIPVIHEFRGQELPGFLSWSLFVKMVKRRAISWKEPSETTYHQTAKDIDALLVAALVQEKPRVKNRLHAKGKALIENFQEAMRFEVITWNTIDLMMEDRNAS